MKSAKVNLPIITNFWGMKNYYYRILDSIKIFRNLKDEILQNGFNDYSKKGITSFFSFRYPVLNLTMFDCIYKFDYGLRINKESRIDFRPEFSENENISFENAKKHVESLLLDSIRKFVGNNKRIGILLSGGLDSSILCSMTRKLYPKIEIYTYSVGFKGDSEFRYSSKVAKLNNTKHTKITLSYKDFFGLDSILPALIKQKGAPLHPNELPLAIANMRARKDLCDIVLCGEGSDDIFCGYDRLLRIYLQYSLDSKHIMQEYRYFSTQKVRKLIREEYLMNDCELIESILNEYDLADSKSCIESKIQNKMLYFIQRLHTQGLIERGLNALKFSDFKQGFVFLDSNLVKYVNNLPFDFKLRFKQNAKLDSNNYKNVLKYNNAKFILKKIAENYLPKSIIYRTKKGFPVPFEKWDLHTNIPLNDRIFKSDNLDSININFNGWEKFMIYNLNTFFTIFDKYRI